jgi:exodeoxyribonuclease VII large subunit
MSAVRTPAASTSRTASSIAAASLARPKECLSIIAAERIVAAGRNRLERLNAALETLNPRRQLERGYAMVTDGKEVITSSKQPPRKKLQILFADGTLEVESK